MAKIGHIFRVSTKNKSYYDPLPRFREMPELAFIETPGGQTIDRKSKMLSVEFPLLEF